MSLIATSKNSIITFSSIFTGPPKILDGFSSDYIIEIPDVEMVKSTMGCDGLINRAVVAKKIEGSFSFWSTSPSIFFIYDAQTAVYNVGLPLVGSLNVIFPTSAVMFTYNDFSFESMPKGYEAADEVKPIKIKWSSQPPNKASLGAAATTLLGLL